MDFQLIQKFGENRIELYAGTLTKNDYQKSTSIVEDFYEAGENDNYYINPRRKYTLRLDDNCYFEGRTIGNFAKLAHVTNRIRVEPHPGIDELL